MQYDFNVPLYDLAGNIIKDNKEEDITIGKLISNALVNQSKGDALKFHSWAMDMYNCRSINLDRSDVKTLREFIENNETITVLGKAQIFDLLDKGKE